MSFRTVLVVDDEEPLRQLLAVILRDRGYEARCVGSGEEALRELAAHDYDLVLTDVRMPRLDGPGLCRALQAEPALRDTPVLILTSNADQESLRLCREAGARDVLLKPIGPHILHDAVQRHAGITVGLASFQAPKP